VATDYILLEIKNPNEIYKELAEALVPHREKPTASVIFIVEGSLAEPRIGIRYPGYKLKPRVLNKPNKSSALWANLLDFEVIPFVDGQQGTSKLFTYAGLLNDFYTYKKDNDIFWEMIKQVHKDNTIEKVPPKLGGIDPRQFLEMLKWMWLQEDVNYRLSSEETKSPLRYSLQNKNGKPTSKGAGRNKFYAALILVRENHFDAASLRKIIP
jgi:hypothetical protein